MGVADFNAALAVAAAGRKRALVGVRGLVLTASPTLRSDLLACWLDVPFLISPCCLACSPSDDTEYAYTIQSCHLCIGLHIIPR